MDKLSTRVMALEGPDRETFIEAFVAIHGPKPERVHGGSQELTDWLLLFNPFFHLLEANGWLSAAEMLVPKGWGKTLTEPSDGPISEAPCSALVFNLFMPEPNRFTSASASLPLALCAAALKARGL